jgi:hypothetical protein
MNLTPREDFRKSTHAKGWTDLCAGSQFQEAARSALILYMQKCQYSQSQSESALKLLGAQEFLQTLMSMAESAPQPTPIGMPQLNRT